MHKWAYRPFLEFQQCIKFLNLETTPCWISLNGDSSFRAFNQIQKIHNSEIRLNPNLLTHQKDFIVMLTDQIQIKITQKGLKNIQKGKAFSFPTSSFLKFALESKGKLNSDEAYQFVFNNGFDFEINIIKKDEFN